MNKKYTLSVLILGVLIICYFLHIYHNNPDSEVISTLPENAVEYFDENGSVVTITSDNKEAIQFEGLGYPKEDFARTVSASGEKYENADKSMTVWMKGEEISVYDENELVYVGSLTPPADIMETEPSEGQSQDNTEADLTLSDSSWIWVEAIKADGTILKPKQAEAFTINFNADGTLRGTTDCNSFFGEYKVTGSSVALTPLGTTRMACEETQEADFISSIANSASYYFKNDRDLILKQTDGSEVSFKAGVGDDV